MRLPCAGCPQSREHEEEWQLDPDFCVFVRAVRSLCYYCDYCVSEDSVWLGLLKLQMVSRVQHSDIGSEALDCSFFLAFVALILRPAIVVGGILNRTWKMCHYGSIASVCTTSGHVPLRKLLVNWGLNDWWSPD